MKYIKKGSLLFILLLSIFWMSYNSKDNQKNYSSNYFDSSFINHNKWKSGKAEIVVYEINKETTIDFKGEVSIMKTKDTLFMSLTKHLIDLITLKKANEPSKSTQDAFLFVQLTKKDIFNTGANTTTTLQVIKENLQPIKLTISDQSFEGNSFVEHQFRKEDNSISQYILGDAVEGKHNTLEYDKNFFGLEQIPLLVRALDFNKKTSYILPLLTYKMDIPLLAMPFVGDNTFEVKFTKIKEETIEFNGEEIKTDVIKVDYPDNVFPPVKTIGHMMTTQETYWITKSSERLLLKGESNIGTFSKGDIKTENSFKLAIIDTLNIDWWNKGENLDLRLYLKGYRDKK